MSHAHVLVKGDLLLGFYTLQNLGRNIPVISHPAFPLSMIPTFRFALHMSNEVSIRAFRTEDTSAVVKLWANGVRGWIYHLAVAPEHRRQGHATKLVRAAEDGLRKLGCKKINLQVRTNNHEVVAFYRSIGHEIEERISMGRHV